MYFTPRQRKVAGGIAEATGDCYSGYCTAASESENEGEKQTHMHSGY